MTGILEDIVTTTVVVGGIGVGIVGFAADALADVATLSWDTQRSDYYQVHHSTQNMVPFGNGYEAVSSIAATRYATTQMSGYRERITVYTIPGETNYFVVTAHYNSGAKSNPSNQVSVTPVATELEELIANFVGQAENGDFIIDSNKAIQYAGEWYMPVDGTIYLPADVAPYDTLTTITINDTNNPDDARTIDVIRRIDTLPDFDLDSKTISGDVVDVYDLGNGEFSIHVDTNEDPSLESMVVEIPVDLMPTFDIDKNFGMEMTVDYTGEDSWVTFELVDIYGETLPFTYYLIQGENNVLLNSAWTDVVSKIDLFDRNNVNKIKISQDTSLQSGEYFVEVRDTVARHFGQIFSGSFDDPGTNVTDSGYQNETFLLGDQVMPYATTVESLGGRRTYRQKVAEISGTPDLSGITGDIPPEAFMSFNMDQNLINTVADYEVTFYFNNGAWGIATLDGFVEGVNKYQVRTDQLEMFNGEYDPSSIITNVDLTANLNSYNSRSTPELVIDRFIGELR